jgi:SAM-dependent methyltransferase
MSRNGRIARAGYNWLSQFVDPNRPLRAAKGLFWFTRDYRAYRRQPGAEPIAWLDLMPALHERIATHEIDSHYFFVNPWAARRIVAETPALHVDVASQTVLSTMLSAVVPSVYVDYRPLTSRIRGLSACAGDLLRLPFRSDSIRSLSCLHVAEHVGLGRYGDALDPNGTRKAAAELARVLAPGGNLFFAVPVGRERVAFNAHRIHASATVLRYFPTLRLREFSGVDDRGCYREDQALDAFADSNYACGFFWFTKG